MSDRKDTRKIIVDFNDGGVSVDYWARGANHADYIRWEGNSRFVIEFDQSTPFRHFKYQSKKENDLFVVEEEVLHNDDNLGAKRFKYSIAATQNGDIDIIDPEIIVPRGHREDR